MREKRAAAEAAKPAAVAAMESWFAQRGVHLEEEISVHDLRFITSQTDNEIIHRFVSELTKYYGVPDISDDKEDSYHWYLPSGMAVRARHLHAPDGGWTVYFYY